MTTFAPAPKLARSHASHVRLKGGKCTCGRTMIPYRQQCPDCQKEMKQHVFLQAGTILYTTTVHAAPPGFETRTPYTVALIELDEGPRLFAHIVDSADNASGARVQGTTRRIQDRDDGGPIRYAVSFKVTSVE